MALGQLHAERQALRPAREAYVAARDVVDRLKSGLRDPGLRASFENGTLIRQVYERAGTYESREP